MANIFDKFLNSMKLYDESDLDNDDEDIRIHTENDTDDLFTEEEAEPVRERRSLRHAFFRQNSVSEEDEDAPEKQEEKPAYERPAYEKPAYEKRSARVFSGSRSSTAMPASAFSAMEVSMICPESIEDAKEVCDKLLRGQPVVINMEGLQTDIAQRIIDFTSGACYSLNGNLKPINGRIFMVSPNSIELTGEFKALESGPRSAASI